MRGCTVRWVGHLFLCLPAVLFSSAFLPSDPLPSSSLTVVFLAQAAIPQIEHQEISLLQA